MLVRMTWKISKAVLALLALFSPQVDAHLSPRQTTFNGNATTTMSQTANRPTPPPCCWIVVGEYAAVYHNWYSSTAEQVVGMFEKHPSIG